MEKTNVMRLLDKTTINYQCHFYRNDLIDGISIANELNKDCETVFKTLVTVANTKEYFVFVIPVNHSLNLKKAAKQVNVKSIEMIKQKELLPLTGYIHGGCSPIGMKKKFKTIINDTAYFYNTITFSAGKIGYQIEMNPNDLISYIDGEYADVIE